MAGIPKQQFSIVIQAGGRSERMGQDKGLVSLNGKPLVQHILDQVDDLSTDIFIISNTPQTYQRFALPVYPDLIQGIGALGGIYSAVHYASLEYCLILACDMPFINRELIELLLDLSPGYDVVIPRLQADEFAEPFRALYSKRCLAAIEKAIQSGKRRVISFFQDVRVRYVDWDEFSHIDPLKLTFFNINTPGDLVRAQEILDE